MGVPWTTVVAWPLASDKVVVEPAVAAALAHLVTSALASKEPMPVARS